MIPVKRTSIRITPDPERAILKFLPLTAQERIEPIVTFVQTLDAAAVEQQLQELRQDFAHRHPQLEAVWRANFQRIISYIGKQSLSTAQELLLGAYFTHEYTIEAAALFNPSIVWHPDQSGLPDGTRRFILSLRATGEGHISSITFRSGIVAATGDITLDDPAATLTTGHLVSQHEEVPASATTSNYDRSFSAATPLSSRVIFPHAEIERNGMEDVRFVRFHDAGRITYLGTYTAYDGHRIQPQLIETDDFIHFRIRQLHGSAATNKGMALFPEKIDGRYAMIGRQGGRNLSMMYADELYHWPEYRTLQTPQRGWEMLQMGNCGSPIKTSEGWLLLTHAVGPMRQYVLSFTLLDLHHPERVIASLDQPLLRPNDEERMGYVPNVLYTCGLVAHRGQLIIPYAMSDLATSFAIVDQTTLLQELLKTGK